MCWCAPRIHIWWARCEALGRISRLEKEGKSPSLCRAAVEISLPPESDEWERVESSGNSINKLSSPLLFCILFQVQLPGPPPVPVSNDSKPSTSAVVSPLSFLVVLGNSHFHPPPAQLAVQPVIPLHACLSPLSVQGHMCFIIHRPLCCHVLSSQQHRASPRRRNSSTEFFFFSQFWIVFRIKVEHGWWIKEDEQGMAKDGAWKWAEEERDGREECWHMLACCNAVWFCARSSGRRE